MPLKLTAEQEGRPGVGGRESTKLGEARGQRGPLSAAAATATAAAAASNSWAACPRTSEQLGRGGGSGPGRRAGRRSAATMAWSEGKAADGITAASRNSRRPVLSRRAEPAELRGTGRGALGGESAVKDC